MAAAIRKYCSPAMDFDLAEGGLYLWGRLNPAISPTELLRQAATLGISFVPGDAFYAHGAASHEIRLCFATHDEERLNEGIRRLGRALAATGATAATSVSPPAAGRPII